MYTHMIENRNKILIILESMVANLQRNIKNINNLNVFPVPDGDTGSNMFSTLLSAWNNIKDSSEETVKIFEDFSNGALLGARGNSGVILSQIIRGFYEGLKLLDSNINKSDNIKLIFKEMKKFSYEAVSKPVEGTILSVVRELSENFEGYGMDFSDDIKEIYDIAKSATKKTPDQLEILKKTGVVDSGAYGLTIMISGIKKALEGRALKITTRIAKSSFSNHPKLFKADPTINIGYCTECILTLRNPNKFKRAELEKKLKKIGDSIVLIKDHDILKLHIHSKNPGIVFNELQKYGEFSATKIENMTSQVFSEHNQIFKKKTKLHKLKKNVNEEETLEKELNLNLKKKSDSGLIEDKLGIIVVSNGIGLNNEFDEMGVDIIVSGGQTMNPSVNDFIYEIEKLKYKNIIILPNNSNIILTVEMVKRSIRDRNIFIIKTKSLAQGLVAMYHINKEMVDFENFRDGVEKSVVSIFGGEITKATRDTDINDLKIKKDDYIAIINSEIIANDYDTFSVAKKLIDYILEKSEEIEIINILYNEKVNNLEIEELQKYIKNKNKNLEIISRYGGQKLYNYIIFGE